MAAQFEKSGVTAFPGNGKVASHDDEVDRLRRELKRVTEERDFLKAWGANGIARLMKLDGIVVRTRRKYRVTTTDSNHSHPVAPNLVARRYAIEQVARLDRTWASDITYVRTFEGWLYLAVVLDRRSRRVVGWSMSQSLESIIVLDALRMALIRRRPGSGILHHSDGGSQYAGDAFQRLLRDHGMIRSMSRRGDCWDNAVVESFNATIKTELIHRRVWPFLYFKRAVA